MCRLRSGGESPACTKGGDGLAVKRVQRFQRFKVQRRKPQAEVRRNPDERQESSIGLLGRFGYVGYFTLAQRRIWLRSHSLLRRPGAGRRSSGGQEKSAADGRQQSGDRRSARRVCQKLCLPDAARQRRLRRIVFARHIHRPAVDRQGADRRRRARKSRRGLPWRHGQGQRSGALRADLLCAQARHQSHRSLARMEFKRALDLDRLCAQAWHPGAGHQGQTLQHRSQLVSHQLRRRRPRGSLEGTAGGYVRLVPTGGAGAQPRRIHRDRLSARRSGGSERQKALAGESRWRA